MIDKLLISFLLCTSVWASDKLGSLVLSADGRQYKVVREERKLSNGASQIAEYVLVGDNSGTRYAMHLTPKGSKPSFWKITGP